MPETLRVKYPLVPPGLPKFSAKRLGGNSRAMFKVPSPSHVNQVILSAKKPVRVLNDSRGRWGASSASVGWTDYIQVDAVGVCVQIR